jgi:hypothetical protein
MKLPAGGANPVEIEIKRAGIKCMTVTSIAIKNYVAEQTDGELTELSAGRCAR